ncbi:hypothetical protein COO60DRAFT_87439 [Scenedesmus sp. NREL 46B-D3]|nr:hypothetical protein COO60DRAFT_87439 [Scenedesmus sp. NREL 46B-D3]
MRPGGPRRRMARTWEGEREQSIRFTQSVTEYHLNVEHHNLTWPGTVWQSVRTLTGMSCARQNLSNAATVDNYEREHPFASGIQTGGERHLHQWAKVPAPTRTPRTCTPDVARGPHVQTSGASQLPFQACANPCCMCELPQLRLHCSCRAMPQSPGLQTQLLLQQQHAARSNQPCKAELFETGAVHEETYFQQDLEAISGHRSS